MANWQRKARLVIAVAAVAFAIVVAFAFRGRDPASGATPVTTDPKAVAESAAGRTVRLNRDREQVRIEYDRLLTYQDGSAKMAGVTIVTERAGGRTFTITGKEAEVANNESNLSLVGDVRLAVTDGLTVNTERVTYTENGGFVHAPGPIAFARGRLSGTGVGLVYDKGRDVLTLLDDVVVRVMPDAAGRGGLEVTAGTAALDRVAHVIRFERGMKAVRGAETTEAAAGLARLSEDEERLEALELRGNSRMSGAGGVAGGLEAVSGRDIDLRYRPDGETLEHVLVNGAAAIGLAGASGHASRRITSDTVEISLGHDGSSPTALSATGNVELTFPAEPDVPARTIRAQTLDSSGEAGRGLTSGLFSGRVVFRERGAQMEREARSATLKTALSEGLGSIDDATFSGAVRFTEGEMIATAAMARYLVVKGTLDLSGSEPGMETPRVVNERLAVAAARIDVTLSGPLLQAVGDVKSEISPAPRGAEATSKDTKLPALLKPDQPVIVTAGMLTYDGAAGSATYVDSAQLYQGDTFIKGNTILLDERSGDLMASGSVTTTIALEQETPDKRKERVRSVASANDMQYEERLRRATYTGNAHVIGTQGDMTAARIDLYLKPSGSELERVEAFDAVTLRDQNRKTSGDRMTYFSVDERYVVTGAPVTIIDECGRDTTGKTLTFYRTTDRIVVDGNEQFRTQTKGVSTCP
jgi:LPS export ABC transporter protein LptC